MKALAFGARYAQYHGVQRVLRVLVACAALVAVPSTAEAAPTTQLTLSVEPTHVDNGGVVVLSGTADCESVEIGAHPGALGIRSIGPIIAPVVDGQFSVQVQLPLFLPDPSRPGLNDEQNFGATCAGTVEPVATATLHVTGIELAATGSSVGLLTRTGLAAAAIGLLFIGAARRAAQRTRQPA